MTFVFSDSLSSSSAERAPPADAVTWPESLDISPLPSTSSPLSPISQDSTLAFSAPYQQAPDFLSMVQEIPAEPRTPSDTEAVEGTDAHERKRWIMKAAKGDGNESRRTFRTWLGSVWTEFVDLLKVDPLSSPRKLVRADRVCRMRKRSISSS